MIYVEGLDNTGKSTLVRHIHEEFEIPVSWGIGNKHDTGAIHERAHEEADRDLFDPLWVYDRSRWISEYIYTPILKSRPLAFNTDHYFEFMMNYITTPQLLIYCVRPLDRIRKTWQDREQLKGVDYKLEKLDWAYQRTLGFLAHLFSIQLNGSRMILWNFETMDLIDVFKSVQAYKEVLR